MGEVVVSSEEVEKVKSDSETEKENGEFQGNKRKKKKPGSSASGEVVKWERFLPRMALRVLLVEADDSTRQIIAALLRKCSYRVAAVPDGLKAWEMLKGKPHNIDLILTEVDLPSISGFALLTLIMEHEICKSIPVIMMSSQDSISTVYKCMLRGAADYLVKPIRRNELRNLWQHLIVGGNSPQDESVGQKKVEATSENNAASNHSSGCLANFQRTKEQTEKGSDAQSSCTKPDMEAESAHMDNMQEFSRMIQGKSLPSESQKHEAHANFNQKPLVHEMKTGVDDACQDAYITTMYKGVELESQRRDANISVEAGDAFIDSPREAIDFMGTFNRNCNSSSISSTGKFDSSPHLDLSLRRCNLNVFENHATQERPTLWHPNSSAFTRYTSRVSQPLHSTLTSVRDQKKESGTNSEKMLSNVISEYNSDTPSPTLTSQRSMIPLTTGATGKWKQTEVPASCTPRRVFPVQVPVKGIRLNNLCNGHNSVISPIFCPQSSSSPVPSPSSANQQEPAFRVNLFRHSSFETNNSGQLYDQLGSNTNKSTNQPLHKLDQKLDSIEDRGHISPTTDQSANSSFCNGSLSQLNSIAYGSTGASNGNVDQVAVIRAPPESKNDDSFLSPGGNSHRFIQREAALTKFRLKRKDRCYEKKVRYESRKKLAEQRPRVKGQFVRQVQADPMHTEAERHYGNSSDG
ncbi:PREDICTED: two-component response regulator-like APRR5 isoform X2 [Theobroma cacao]|uniref:Two-component response regulator-like APRR5 isoform X2 n=1 Tax=Theobroma cacao TaxID=3641 RepID=A0AB32VBG4_THECC|nr:PREDICTED: two-component response regulator-like APRR5 isoform X2 [Theobroma cacao]